MHALQAVGVERERVAGRLAGGLQIDRLSADHADACRRRAPSTSTTSSLRCVIAASAVDRLAREQRERLGLQAVAGENRDAVAVDDVQRRPAAAQRVVVHRRQVVVDQRVGVNQFDRAGGRQRERRTPRPAASLSARATASAAASVEHRPQTLAAGEDAVAHRLADERRARGRRRQIPLERVVDTRRERCVRNWPSASVVPEDVTSASAVGLVAGRGRPAPAAVRRVR